MELRPELNSAVLDFPMLSSDRLLPATDPGDSAFASALPDSISNDSVSPELTFLFLLKEPILLLSAAKRKGVIERLKVSKGNHFADHLAQTKF